MADSPENDETASQPREIFRRRQRFANFFVAAYFVLLAAAAWFGDSLSPDGKSLLTLSFVAVGVLMFAAFVRVSYCPACGGRMKFDGQTCSACGKTY